MKNMWKCYKVFAGTGYRWGMLLGIPALFVAGNAFLSALCCWEVHCEVFGCAFLAGAEIMADYWVFSGICSKDTGQFEYLKSSAEGPGIIRRGLVADTLRRFVWMLAVSLVCWGITELGSYTQGVQAEEEILKRSDTLLILFLMVLFYYIISMVGILIARYFGVFYIQFSIAGFGVFLSSFLQIAIIIMIVMGSELPGRWLLWIMTGLLALLAAGISLLGIWNVMRKVRKSYYDK